MTETVAVAVTAAAVAIHAVSVVEAVVALLRDEQHEDGGAGALASMMNVTVRQVPQQ